MWLSEDAAYEKLNYSRMLHNEMERERGLEPPTDGNKTIVLPTVIRCKFLAMLYFINKPVRTSFRLKKEFEQI